MALNNLKKKIPNSKNLNGPNDLELMQLMMSKIKQTEGKCAILERELTRKVYKFKANKIIFQILDNEGKKN